MELSQIVWSAAASSNFPLCQDHKQVKFLAHLSFVRPATERVLSFCLFSPSFWFEIDCTSLQCLIHMCCTFKKICFKCFENVNILRSKDRISERSIWQFNRWPHLIKLWSMHLEMLCFVSICSHDGLLIEQTEALKKIMWILKAPMRFDIWGASGKHCKSKNFCDVKEHVAFLSNILYFRISQ